MGAEPSRCDHEVCGLHQSHLIDYLPGCAGAGGSSGGHTKSGNWIDLKNVPRTIMTGLCPYHGPIDKQRRSLFLSLSTLTALIISVDPDE